MMPPSKLLELAKKRGLDAIAITDHNRLTLARGGPLPVIAGEEVKTTKGEVIGLFLTEEILKGLSPEETFDRIREQGGLIVIPHPFDRFRARTALLLHNVKPPKDSLIEVRNARYIIPRFEQEAFVYAKKHRFSIVAGSDAHTPVEVGRAWTEVPEFSDLEELYYHLKKGKTSIGGSYSSTTVHLTVPVIKILHFLGVIPH
jgi:predicted metal-dependent phosphoesterase TrpH